jgi:hypothetical protein
VISTELSTPCTIHFPGEIVSATGFPRLDFCLSLPAISILPQQALVVETLFCSCLQAAISPRGRLPGLCQYIRQLRQPFPM